MNIPSYDKVHNLFKLNGYHLNADDLCRVAYSFIKEGEEFEKPVGDFLLDWFNDKDYIEMFTSGTTGLPKTIVVSTVEIREAIDEPVSAIVDAVKVTLDKTPPELAADIMEKGIVITGGGALLHGLDRRLADETGMPIIIAKNPLFSVVVGSGQCLEEFDVLKSVLISSNLH